MLNSKLLYFLGLGEIVAKCGHKTKAIGKVEVVDKKGKTLIVTIENVRNPEYCIDCLGKKITVSDISDIQQAKPIK